MNKAVRRVPIAEACFVADVDRVRAEGGTLGGNSVVDWQERTAAGLSVGRTCIGCEVSCIIRDSLPSGVQFVGEGAEDRVRAACPRQASEVPAEVS